MKSLDLQSFLQNSCIEPDEFVLNVDSDFFRLLPNLLQSHNTCSHFVCIPCNINLRFLRCIYQYILECLLRSRRKVVLTGCLYVHEKHYIHILTNPIIEHFNPNSLAFRLRGYFFSFSQHLSEIGSSMYFLYFLKLRSIYSRELFWVLSVNAC